MTIRPRRPLLRLLILRLRLILTLILRILIYACILILSPGLKQYQNNPREVLLLASAQKLQALGNKPCQLRVTSFMESLRLHRSSTSAYKLELEYCICRLPQYLFAEVVHAQSLLCTARNRGY
jgi:hypothetical protein